MSCRKKLAKSLNISSNFISRSSNTRCIFIKLGESQKVHILIFNPSSRRWTKVRGQWFVLFLKMSTNKSNPWDFPNFISKQISNKKWPTQRVHCAGFKLNSFCFFWCAHVSSKQQSIMKQLEFNFKAMCQAWCQVVLRQQIHQGILKNWIHALGKLFSQSYGVSECRYVLFI